MTQSKKCCVHSEHVENVFTGSDGMTIKINFTSGRGSEAAKYTDKARTLFVLQQYFLAEEAEEKSFEFPTDREVSEMMETQKYHSSRVNSRKVSHGGS